MANENNEYFAKSNEQNANKETLDVTNDSVNAADVTTTTPEKHNNCNNNSTNTEANAQTTMDEAIGLAAACTSGKLNDLVADLCITSTTATTNSSISQPPMVRNNVPATNSSFGDYTNIRATTSTPSSSRISDVSTCLPDSSTETAAVAAATASPAPHTAPVQNSSSSFSFKHFLNSSNSVTAPSTTVTSLDPVSGSGAAQCPSTTSATTATGTPTATTTAAPANTFATSSNSLQTSTGARPKVPQSVSVSATMMHHSSSSGITSDAATSKMKRSPRFSSFDSQASLAEYAGAPLDNLGCGFVSCSLSRRADLEADDPSEDYFNTTHYNSMRTSASSSMDYDARQYVPRSQSNFDLQSSSPRRRVGSNMTARPTRLALNYVSAGLVSSTSAAKMKLDLPFENAATNYTGPSTSAGATGLPCTSRQQAASVNEYPPAAAALPDFVQDHWLDSWYAHDVHLNSPPNSPISDFPDDLVGAAGSSTELLTVHAEEAAACLNNEAIAAATSGAGGGGGGSNIVGASCGSSGANDSTVGSKMLPDFLSDGPIIHSSQRLADVAVGLPSNSVGSPDESHMTAQLSRLLAENDRLQREVNDMHLALQKQTRRANELERQQQEQQRRETTNTAEKQKSNKSAEQVLKLQQQVASMRGEIDRLRRENELLREEGAVGGAIGATGTMPAGATGGGGGGGASSSSTANARNNSARPSKQQQQQQQNLSRDLRMAASTAETHLRQLLAGVDNLRQMATQIENAECSAEYNVSPDLFTDFPDSCYDYDEYTGPAS